MTVLAIIPARGGSKSIPCKNITMVAGKPLIAYTIEAARGARLIDRVLVSTDSAEITEVARACGAEVPFLRPPEFARDETPGIEPILHTIKWLDKEEGYRPHYVMMLQPTSPLRSTRDIDKAIDLIAVRDADAVVSVCENHHHPYWTKKIDSEGKLQDFIEFDGEYPRRQDLPAAYALNGSIYLARREVLLRNRGWYTDDTLAYVMPPERSLDIDSPWDTYIVDLVLRDKEDKCAGS